MSRLAEIEAQLQARWDRETLEIYADALQMHDDPRGFLIAFALAGRPDSPELVRKHDQLLEGWLAGFQHGPPGWMRAHSGFVTLHFWTLESVTAFLASHLAPFLLRASFYLAPAECSAALETLVGRAHPWCRELELGFQGLERDAVPIGPAIIERLAEAMPHLTKLRLRGPRVLHAIPPQIEQLALEHPRALADRLSMPAVVELDLPYIHFRGPWRDYVDLLHPHTFPGLRRLDFEQNEGHLGDVLEVLEHAAVTEQLSRLRLPSLRGEDDVRRVRALLDRTPDLVVEIARSHRPLQALLPVDEPRIRVPDPVPCAPHDSMDGAADHLVISIPGWNRTFELHIGTLACNTESCYALFSSEQQAALTVLWDRLPTLGPTPISFPAAAMARVVETMMLTDPDAQIGFEPWKELGDVLAQSPCAVTIARRR